MGTGGSPATDAEKSCCLKNLFSHLFCCVILEQVDLKTAGFTKNKLWKNVFNFIGTCLTKSILSADLVAVTIFSGITWEDTTEGWEKVYKHWCEVFSS